MPWKLVFVVFLFICLLCSVCFFFFDYGCFTIWKFMIIKMSKIASKSEVLKISQECYETSPLLLCWTKLLTYKVVGKFCDRIGLLLRARILQTIFFSYQQHLQASISFNFIWALTSLRQRRGWTAVFFIVNIKVIYLEQGRSWTSSVTGKVSINSEWK